MDKAHTHHYLIVGAGFSGAVVARQLADAGKKVLILDKRQHIGGNAYDRLDEYGVLIHPYGPHIFHTRSEKIFKYLSRFTGWREYHHRVLARVGDKLVPVPINLTTINRLYNLNLDEKGAIDYLEKARTPLEQLQTSEDVVLNAVGPDLYKKLFYGYTLKQWGLKPSELSASVTSRIPTRTNTDDRYFTDEYQGMPDKGYTALFHNLLDSPNIQIELGVDFFKEKKLSSNKKTIYTGPIDAFFDNCYGELPYRSLEFQHEHIANCERYQEVGTVNFPNDHEYTRITEFKHLTGQKHKGTSIVREFPKSIGDPYYPIPRPENETLYRRYKSLAKNTPDVYFVGRLAQYRYYNMDQVVAAAMKAASTILA